MSVVERAESAGSTPRRIGGVSAPIAQSVEPASGVCLYEADEIWSGCPDRTGPPDPACDWLPAGPFRCHVRQLTAATGTPWPVLAVLAQVSLASVRTLMNGRDGRQLRRLHPRTANRLYDLDAERVRRSRSWPVPAGPTTRRLRALSGVTDLDGLALRLGVPPSVFGSVRDKNPTHCSELVAASAEAAYRLAQLHRSRTLRPTAQAPAAAA